MDWIYINCISAYYKKYRKKLRASSAKDDALRSVRLLFLILPAPDDHVFGRLAAADAYVGDMLLFKRDTAGLYAACHIFQLFFALCLAAPHSADEARMVCCNI